jgi:hypothetical protein
MPSRSVEVAIADSPAKVKIKMITTDRSDNVCIVSPFAKGKKGRQA